VKLIVNGQPLTADLPGSATLLDLLRDAAGLVGTKRACDRGECGACTVLLDGRPIYACLALAHGCEGHEVRTIESLGASHDGGAHPLQRAFVAEDAAQCGFCTPGQLMAAAALLAGNADPSDDEIRAALAGNLCRCGTYPKIVRAVRRAAADLRARPGATTGA
jgi:aerobic-type carbon monoxide dehydrogenase small subunit (CoxS/CutS family)